MKRLATGLVGAAVLLTALFLLPPWWFFVASLVVVEWAVVEYVGIFRSVAPGAPLRALLALVPLAAVVVMLATQPTPAAAPAELLAATQSSLLAFGLFLTVVAGTVVLLGRTPVPEAIAAFGAFGFGVPYFALAAVALGRLAAIDPWLLFLGFAIVQLGDTAAYYVGSRIGRHRLAPVVSPKKSWEGAAAGLVTALAAAAAWSWWRLGEVSPGLLALAVATAVAAQIGDLVESLLKRASGVKDSGRSLPGHGGILDRADATFFALPVLLLGVWLLGPETLVP
ncbi:MAG TPA: phosphatidate cytidylyltransferase [Thermoanaerobaculia bacterium]|nr:phosphatidate cytidylyltransferase [Thermoanaerobaculia bacterium]